MPTLVNTIDSKELYAARAVADAAGNDIAQTYATKAELPTQVQSDWDQTVTTAVDFIKNKPTIVNYVAGTNITFTETGAGTEISATGGGSSANADWDAVSGPEEILNKPTPKTLTAGSNITVTETASTITIGANVPAPTPQVNADWDAVSGPEEILNKPSIPAVDQTYDGTSTNAQSGVAVASGISDAVAALPTNLSSAQIQALKEALGVDETVLYYNASGAVGTAAVNLSESIYNFERVRIDLCSYVNNYNWVSTVEAPIQYITNNYLKFCFTDRFDNTWRWITWRCDYPITNSGTTITLESTAFGGALDNGNWVSSVNINANFHLYKVVGIKRVASN